MDKTSKAITKIIGRDAGVAIGDESEDRIHRIAALQFAINKAMTGILYAAMDIGDELREQKKSMKHGAFQPWLEKNMHRMNLASLRTARDYMRMAENRAYLEGLPDINSIAAGIRALRQLLAADTTPGDVSQNGRALPESDQHEDNHQQGEDNHQQANEGRVTLPKGSKKLYAVQNMPGWIQIDPDQFARLLAWYESPEFADSYKASRGNVGSKPKKRTKGVRIHPTIKKKTKKQIERESKRLEMTQGELIESLLEFASKIKQTRGGGK